MADSLNLDLNVTAVASGGSWSAGTTRGTIRVVELSQGFEEIQYTVVVQWLEVNENEHSIRIRQSLRLNDLVPDYYSVASPTLSWRRGRVVLTLRAARTPMSPLKSILTFEIGAPGVVRQIEAP